MSEQDPRPGIDFPAPGKSALDPPKHGWPLLVDICPQCRTTGAPCGGRHIGAEQIPMVPASQLDQVREERETWRGEAWQCYLAAGAEPDGATAEHLNLGEALANVREMRQEEGEEADRADKLQARVEELEGERDIGDLTVHLSGRTAVGLRYVLPLVATALEGADEDGDTTAMLEDAVGALDLALPPEFRGAIDDAQMAERRMDVIDLQRKAGVRPLATSPSNGEQPAEKQIGDVLAEQANALALEDGEPAPEVSQDCGGEAT